jgi:hypothetical protein
MAQTTLAIAGVTMFLGVAVTIPLFFVYSGPPPAWNVLTRDLLTLVVAASLLVFMACFAHLVRRAGEEYGWLASISYGATIVFVGIVLVSTALEAGVVFGAAGIAVDPTIEGPLADANILMHGSIKRMLTVLMLVPCGYSVRFTRIFPGWVAWSAYLIAAANLLFVPSLYFGIDVTEFYSAIGWGNSAFVASFLAYWVLAVSISSLIQQRRARRNS